MKEAALFVLGIWVGICATLISIEKVEAADIVVDGKSEPSHCEVEWSEPPTVICISQHYVCHVGPETLEIQCEDRK